MEGGRAPQGRGRVEKVFPPMEGGRAPQGRGRVEKEFPWKVEELHREEFPKEGGSSPQGKGKSSTGKVEELHRERGRAP